MKLKKIAVNNFRQFYGQQEIIFASGEQNITIIFGENGKGKTGIFRALMFGLYGSTHIEQDNPKEKIHLVNFIALEEAKNLPVEAEVQLQFESKGKTYQLNRRIMGIKTGEIIKERMSEVELYITDENGNFSPDSITDEDEIYRIINDILHASIKDFFLFDAEKIETLTKTDKSVKEEVKNGIVKLLHIDKLEEAIKLLNKLHATEKRRLLQDSQNLDLNQKQNEIEALANEITDLEEKVSLKESNMLACSTEIEEIETKLAENEDVRKIQDKYRETKERKTYEQRLLKAKKDEMKNLLVANGPNLILKDTYHSVKNYLDQVLVDQQDLIPIEVIEKSLNELVCACCGTNLEENPKHKKQVEFLKENFKRSNLTPLVSLVTSSIHDAQISEEDQMRSINKSLKEFREIKNNIAAIDRQLDDFQADIENKAQEQENLSHLESTLKNKKNELDEFRVDISKMKDQIIEKENNRKAKEKEFNRLLRQNESLKVDAKVLEYIEGLKEQFERVFVEYSDNMRLRLTEEATSIFKLLIDSKDKELISKIDINEKYEIEIIGWDQVNITQDISQGQRQVVALSFITSLAKVAAGDYTDISFPLFMDTPFGRISGTNRDQLIQNIPRLSSQWILLLTDTELSKTEEMEFKATGKLGKWYRLDQIKTGHSEIVELDLNETIATRG
ncbi:DNA sulfur modification protein DndD [Oceanobacillus limi]|uniref:Nuclease SbcCD subunit C n=1 Tax=Oceanobacillus limi TaxID=930131 RepID=A0A1I0FH76_9BACI|nr:AAA family ATPase [Oceanobacillus limi]SET57372.1 DNA sulfur modification protein DndD [Oceanobacillus limi]